MRSPSRCVAQAKLPVSPARPPAVGIQGLNAAWRCVWPTVRNLQLWDLCQRLPRCGAGVFLPIVVFRFESECLSRINPSGAEQNFPHSSRIVGSVLGLWMTAAAVRRIPFDGNLRAVPFASAHLRDLASCRVSDRFSSPRNTDFGASMAEKHRRIRTFQPPIFV